MKNLLKVLLVLAFSTSAFASSTVDPSTVTTSQISAMSSDAQQAWLNGLTAEQYGMLSADVQAWVQSVASSAQKSTLGIQ